MLGLKVGTQKDVLLNVSLAGQKNLPSGGVSAATYQRACWWKVGGVGWMLGVPLDDVVAVVQAQVQKSPSIFYVVIFLLQKFAFISTSFQSKTELF